MKEPIGQRFRRFREDAKLTQRDLETRTGIDDTYISRMEHGKVIPTIKQLEVLIRAIGRPLWHFFYDGKKPPVESQPDIVVTRGRSLREQAFVANLRRALSKMLPADRIFLFEFVEKLVQVRTQAKKSQLHNSQKLARVESRG